MLGYQSAEGKKQSRCYIRFHQTIKRAIDYNQKLYGEKRTKDNSEFRYEHPIRVAGMTEQIGEQSLYDYHLNWLVGILHDSKEDNLVMYSQNINQILKDLLPAERQDVMKYIDQLSKDNTLPKGERKREHVQRMRKLDLVPSYITIFDKYDNSSRFLKDGCGKSQMELNGYYAVSLTCYDIAMKNHESIRQFLNPNIKKFFQNLRLKLGSQDKIKDMLQNYYGL